MIYKIDFKYVILFINSIDYSNINFIFIVIIMNILKMYRKLPPKIKLYEALWCVSDWRVEILSWEQQVWLFSDYSDDVLAKVSSSSWWKYYDVKYSKKLKLIMANDNWSYWQWYLWYPSIALLFFVRDIYYDETYWNHLKWIKRKDLNTKNKNNFDHTKNDIDKLLKERWVDLTIFDTYLDHLFAEIEKLNLWYYWDKQKPPTGY